MTAFPKIEPHKRPGHRKRALAPAEAFIITAAALRRIAIEHQREPMGDLKGLGQG